ISPCPQRRQYAAQQTTIPQEPEHDGCGDSGRVAAAGGHVQHERHRLRRGGENEPADPAAVSLLVQRQRDSRAVLDSQGIRSRLRPDTLSVPRLSPYKETLAWLYGLQRFGIKLGLENIQRLIAELQLDPRGTRVIHVAGTNGKGSVCAMIDSICRAQGYRAGLFTSPHLVTFRERIRVNGEMISENAVANGLSTIRNLTA